MAIKNLDILYVGSELTPLAKAGGLGDVLGALPKAMNPLVDSVAVALPFHEEIRHRLIQKPKRVGVVNVVVGNTIERVQIWKTIIPHTTIPVYLFENLDYISRGRIYQGSAVADPITKRRANSREGQVLRYIFFSFAVAEALQKKLLPGNVIHCHDYHTAGLVALIRTTTALRHLKTIFTIHNLAYFGSAPLSYLRLFQWDVTKLFAPTELVRPKGPRLMQLGISWANEVTTVSRHYALEILSPEFGYGLEKYLRQRQNHLHGIVNGIDTISFDPATDPAVYKNFSVHSIEKRAANKALLQKRCHLPIDPRVPVLGVVARLSTQKGVDSIIAAGQRLAKLPAQLIVCGTGNQDYVDGLKQLQRRLPKSCHFHNAFDTRFSQKVYAGVDIFLMPSRHEPCGLAQLIAMHYGAVPIVRATGGLVDTVKDGKTGFVFEEYSAKALYQEVKLAVGVFIKKPDQWAKMMRAGMSADYSWHRSAKKYVTLYKYALRNS